MKRLLIGFLALIIALFIMIAEGIKLNRELHQERLEKQELVDLYLRELQDNFDRHFETLPEPDPNYKDGDMFFRDHDRIKLKEL